MGNFVVAIDRSAGVFYTQLDARQCAHGGQSSIYCIRLSVQYNDSVPHSYSQFDYNLMSIRHARAAPNRHEHRGFL